MKLLCANGMPRLFSSSRNHRITQRQTRLIQIRYHFNLNLGGKFVPSRNGTKPVQSSGRNIEIEIFKNSNQILSLKGTRLKQLFSAFPDWLMYSRM